MPAHSRISNPSSASVLDDDNEDETMWYQNWGWLVVAIELGICVSNLSKIYLTNVVLTLLNVGM